jgi:uncharacterized membrane protein
MPNIQVSSGSGRGAPFAVQANATLRSPRERLIQTLCFEAVGLAIITPVFAIFAGTSAGESVLVLVVLSATVMGWAALYNTSFDWVELRHTGRVASDRPHRLRLVHSVGLEISASLVTWPLIVWLTPLGWIEALVAELGLTLAYAVYGYLFHLGFDRLRPVRAGVGVGRTS